MLGTRIRLKPIEDIEKLIINGAVSNISEGDLEKIRTFLSENEDREVNVESYIPVIRGLVVQVYVQDSLLKIPQAFVEWETMSDYTTLKLTVPSKLKIKAVGSHLVSEDERVIHLKLGIVE